MPSSNKCQQLVNIYTVVGFQVQLRITKWFPFSFSEQCNQQLGMEDGSIPDEAITASSTHHAKSVGPQNAR